MQRLSMALCPACERVNDADARFCAACGTPLVTRCAGCGTINVRSRNACHHCGLELAPGRNGPETMPDGPVVPLLYDEDPAATEPGDWTLSLRRDPELPAPAAQPVFDIEQLLADPDAPSPVAAPAAPAVPTPSDRELSAKKASRRAAVRRAQRGRGRQDSDALPAASDVLLLEPDALSRSGIAALLEGFGFRPHLAATVAEAEGLSVVRHYALVLLGLGHDALAAADLCRQLHGSRRLRPLAVVAVGDAGRHADRVRMQLAGVDRMIFRPVGRGDLARAIEACGVAMPTDPRRSAG